MSRQWRRVRLLTVALLLWFPRCLITEGHGIPLAVLLTGSNRNDVTPLMPLIQAVPPVRGWRGRPRQRPDTVFADRAYDHDKYREQVQPVGITPIIARRGTGHGSGLGKYRRVVEQTFALLTNCTQPLRDPALDGITMLNEIASRHPEAVSFASGWPPDESLDRRHRRP